MGAISVLLYILFVIAAIVLVVVVLLQEGRGGGFGEALGSHGRETFGVGSKGINTFTGWTAGVFLGCALLLHFLNRVNAEKTVLGDDFSGPAQVTPEAPAAQTPPAQVPPPTPPGDQKK
jgi:preprotein translocase subunit SecG